MKILVLTGSPHRDGTTSVLAREFVEGAEAAGNEVARFDTALMDIGGCIGCDYCRENGGLCVLGDGMADILPKLLEADLVAFVTPVYFFGMTSQLKAAIDRFYAVNPTLCKQAKQAMLLAACADEEDNTTGALTLQYQTMLGYLGWRDAGMLLAFGMDKRSDIENSRFPALAYELGHFAGA